MNDSSSNLELTDLQMSVMRVLWAQPGASVQEIQKTLGRSRPLAISTLTTVLTRLAERDVVAREKVGRQYRWRALVAEHDVTGALIDELTERAFQGDATALVSALLSHRELAPDDLARVRELLDEHEAKPKKARRSKRGRGKAR